jgi:hypothetical protein
VVSDAIPSEKESRFIESDPVQVKIQTSIIKERYSVESFESLIVSNQKLQRKVAQLEWDN